MWELDRPDRIENAIGVLRRNDIVTTSLIEGVSDDHMVRRTTLKNEWEKFKCQNG